MLFKININKIEKMLMKWERKILREIYGPTKENGQWRLKTTESDNYIMRLILF